MASIFTITLACVRNWSHLSTYRTKLGYPVWAGTGHLTILSRKWKFPKNGTQRQCQLPRNIPPAVLCPILGKIIVIIIFLLFALERTTAVQPWSLKTMINQSWASMWTFNQSEQGSQQTRNEQNKKPQLHHAWHIFTWFAAGRICSTISTKQR